MTDPNPPKFRTTLYFTTEVHHKFAEICQREGVAMGEKIEECFLAKYVQDHGPGNPQQKLEIVTLLGRPYKAEHCQEPGCDGKIAFYGLQGKLWLGFCFDHWKVSKFRSWKRAP